MVDKMDSSILASTRWSELDPGCGLLEELARNSGVRELVPVINSVIADCRTKASLAF